jgi:hypothetical protein
MQAAQETPDDAAPAAAAAPTVTPTPDLRPAIIADVVNAVEADPWAEDTWQAAEEGMEVYQDGRVKAESESTALVDVDEGLVRVAPDTTFVYRRPDAGTLELELDAGGQMWLNVDGLKEGETVEVKTPAAVASVRGTRFGVRVESDGTTIVSTKVGTVTVAVATYSVTVKAGYGTVIVPGSPPSAAAAPSPEERMRWGMAAGNNLDVVLPVVDTLNTFTYGGHPQNRSCSQGHYFALGLWDSDLDEHGHAIYDLQAGTSFTVTLPAVSDIALSPTDDLLAYYDAGDLCVVDLDGSNRACQQASSDQFHWSPDGEWLLYYRWTEDMANLFKSRPDGGDVTQLTSYSGGEMISNPAWAPDGSGIAYYRHAEHGVPANLWVMGADGSDPREILQELRYYDPPAWSPDGAQLAVPGYYDQDSGEGGGLYLVSVDGSASSVISGTEGWSCNGVVFAPTESGWPVFFRGYDPEQKGHGGLWAYTPEGGVVHVDGASWGPVWCPNGTLQAAFGFQSGSKDAPVNEVYFFQVEPGLWP